MAKKAVKIEITHRCRDCVHCVPDKSNLSFVDREPILGNCKYQTAKFLINHNYCGKFTHNN